MSIRLVLFAALISLAAACGKEAAKPADCGAVGTAVSGGLKQLSDDERGRAVTAVVEACKRDAWSAAVTGCFAAAKSKDDAKACAGKLTGAQASAFQAAIQAARGGG